MIKVNNLIRHKLSNKQNIEMLYKVKYKFNDQIYGDVSDNLSETRESATALWLTIIQRGGKDCLVRPPARLNAITTYASNN